MTSKDLIDIKEIERRMKLIKKPIDKDQLVKDGILKKIGRSYYLGDVEEIPEEVSLKIKAIAQTSKGVRVTF